MNSIEIRKKFLQFFKDNGHAIVPSSPLIPADDPTLLFANAGMNQFKDAFLGKEKRAYKCAASVQKCVRAGGKHNDLDEVGFTDRHLTFFEMLGNFSFGAYFKEEAIEFAWNFLTKELQIAPEKLSVTVHTSDDDTEQIWHEKIGLPMEKIARLGDEDNFWQMGDIGPCGPCSEIFYDRGPEFEDVTKGGKTTTRFIEIWNNVFMQYNRQADGTLCELEQKGVDTGMGLERLCMVLGSCHLFEIDQFIPLIQFLEKKTHVKYDECQEHEKAAFNVLCDHVRSACMIIADGGYPSNDGRGYVLRKIIRRAALFAQRLSQEMPKLFCDLVPEFISQMGEIYPELKTSAILITDTITQEVERFGDNLVRGRRIFNSYISENRRVGIDELSGKQAFKLYDTYGFPLELTKVLSFDENVGVDAEGFELEMARQRSQSVDGGGEVEELGVPDDICTQFVGYDVLHGSGVITWTKHIDDALWVVVDSTPFYAESGGQVSDTGKVIIDDDTFEVLEVKKIHVGIAGDAILLRLPENVQIKVGKTIKMVVNEKSRVSSEKNHTATHLLQAALTAVLGNQIKQAGSFVSHKFLRFDFTHHKALSHDEIHTVETLVNEWIGKAVVTRIFETTLDNAREKGAISFFGEKYNPENVRVVQVPTISTELCGGTHVSNIGKIGCFKIVSEDALGVGVRRLTAVTGPESVKMFQDRFDSIKALCSTFSVQADGVLKAVEKEQDHIQVLRMQIKQFKKEVLKFQIPRWKEGMEEVGGTPFLHLEFDEVDMDVMRIICNDVTAAKPTSFVFIVSKESGSKIRFMACAGKQCSRLSALNELSAILREKGLKGGGKGGLIQGGGRYGSSKDIIRLVCKWLG